MRKDLSLTVAAALTSGVLFAVPATAQDTIVSYATFPGDGDRELIAGDTTLTGVTGIDMTRGGGLLPASGFNAFNSNGWATNVEGTPTVVNTAAYVEIGFSLDPGFTATLDSLILGSDSSGSGPSQVGVFSSLDNFATPIFNVAENGSFSNSIIDLSSLGTVSGDFTLRFQNTGGSATADPARVGDMDENSTWRVVSYRDPVTFEFSDTQITGTVLSGPLGGDADGDGDVDSDDFNILAFNFGNPGTFADGDFDGDGIVESDDFNILAFNFGVGTSTVLAEEIAAVEAFGASIIPEPSSLALLGLGGFFALRRRRDR
jgi:hypothetical protein